MERGLKSFATMPVSFKSTCTVAMAPTLGRTNTAVDGDHNRAHSGCQVDGKSVCKLMPFSQKILDGFNLNDPTCEEFPMADWPQPDFENGKGQPRNALRCVERKINSAGGGQWLFFRDGKGDQPKRTCDGPMNQDNTDYKFTIEMNTNNANQDLLGYCLSDSQGPANLDLHEFYMDTFSSLNGANYFLM